MSSGFADIEDLAVNYVNNAQSYTEDTEAINYKRSALIKWYRENRRKMPWRGDDIDFKMSAYGTWVSEIMLQQTRVETVIDYWKRWMTEYPTVHALAASTPDEVNKLWAGLGYYRRAQQLLKGAKSLVEDGNSKGELPQDKAKLLQIPGIGPYTAGAILSIAFNKVEPLVDGNVIRVLSRLYSIGDMQLSGAPSSNGAMEKLCWSIATSLVDLESPGDFNQALMELGATVCKPTSPDCAICPVSSACRAKLLVDYGAARRKESLAQFFPTEAESSNKGDGNKQVPLESDVVDLTSSDSICDNDQSSKVKISKNSSGKIDSEFIDHLPSDVCYFPRKVPKKKPQEVTVSVAVLRTNMPKVQVATEIIDLDGAKLTNDDESKITRLDTSPVEEGEGEERYLFVRRPSGGLLANQWEFPSIIMERRSGDDDSSPQTGSKKRTSDGDTLTNSTTGSAATANKMDTSTVTSFSAAQLWAPFPSFLRTTVAADWAECAQTLSVGLESTLPNVPEEAAQCVLEHLHTWNDIDPVTHVFSHQRHTMLISLRQVQLSSIAAPTSTTTTTITAPVGAKVERIEGNAVDGGAAVDAYLDPAKARWMTAEEIVEAGITTGCKKVLDKVVQVRKNSENSVGKQSKASSKAKGKGKDGNGKCSDDSVPPPPKNANAFELMAHHAKFSNSSSGVKKIKGAGTGQTVKGSTSSTAETESKPIRKTKKT